MIRARDYRSFPAFHAMAEKEPNSFTTQEFGRLFFSRKPVEALVYADDIALQILGSGTVCRPCQENLLV